MITGEGSLGQTLGVKMATNIQFRTPAYNSLKEFTHVVVFYTVTRRILDEGEDVLHYIPREMAIVSIGDPSIYGCTRVTQTMPGQLEANNLLGEAIPCVPRLDERADAFDMNINDWLVQQIDRQTAPEVKRMCAFISVGYDGVYEELPLPSREPQIEFTYANIVEHGGDKEWACTECSIDNCTSICPLRVARLVASQIRSQLSEIEAMHKVSPPAIDIALEYAYAVIGMYEQQVGRRLSEKTRQANAATIEQIHKWFPRNRDVPDGKLLVTICDMNKKTKMTNCTISITSLEIPVKLNIRMTTEELLAGCRILRNTVHPLPTISSNCPKTKQMK